MILDSNYINEQDLATCEKLLAKAHKNKDIDRSLIKYPELWTDADPIANTLCFLEDRITYLKQLENLEKANAARWGKE